MVAIERNRQEANIASRLLKFQEVRQIRFPEPGLYIFEEENIISHSEKVASQFSNQDNVKGEFIKALALFIVSPVIIDNFISHNNRRLWYRNLEKIDREVYEFFMRNKLRKNNIFRVTGILQVYETFGINNPRWESELQEIVYTMDYFKEFAIEQKIEITERVTTLAIKGYKDIIKSL